MDARTLRAILIAALLILPCLGASYSTPNFVVTAANSEIARNCAITAERQRRDLAIEWLGAAMPNWSRPCEVTVRTGPTMGAGGATSFLFEGGEVFGWTMSVQGPYERVLDSVLPHEITHTIYASHFRRPLPRWADEGGATSVEHFSERAKHRQWLYEFIRDGRAIPLERLFSLTEYPADVMPLYAQGYSVANYLIQSRGRRTYIKFLETSLQTGSWARGLRTHYGINSVRSLQTVWNDWTRRGCPRLERVSPVVPATAIVSNQPSGTMTQAGSTNVVQPAVAVQPTGATRWETASNDLILRIGKDDRLPQSPANSSIGSTRELTSITDMPPRRLVDLPPRRLVDLPPRRSIAPRRTGVPPRSVAATRSTGSAEGWRQMGDITPLLRALPSDIEAPGRPAVEPRRTSTSTQVASPQELRGPGHILFEWSKQAGGSVIR